MIRLTYDPARSPNPPCEYPALEIANHEIVHTMGFRHTGLSWFLDPTVENSVRTIDCLGTRANVVRYHAAVAYARPRLNLDEDRDPVQDIPTVLAFRGPTVSVGPEVFCALVGEAR